VIITLALGDASTGSSGLIVFPSYIPFTAIMLTSAMRPNLTPWKVMPLGQCCFHTNIFDKQYLTVMVEEINAGGFSLMK